MKTDTIIKEGLRTELWVPSPPLKENSEMELNERAKAIADRCRTVGSHAAYEVIHELLACHEVSKEQEFGLAEEVQHFLHSDPDDRVAARARLRNALYRHNASPSVRVAELENGIRNCLATLEEAEELNIGNYDEEQVAALNVSATNAWKILTEALSPKQEGGG